MNRLKLLGEGLRRLLVYSAVLRPSFLIAFIIIYLPSTAGADWVPGNLMLANLFVDYDFVKSFWFAFALSGAVWALMLTTCLVLDFARDRQRQQDSGRPWLPDPGQKNRWVTIPICRKAVFWLFTLLGAPAAVIVVLKATSESFVSVQGLMMRSCGSVGAAHYVNFVSAIRGLSGGQKRAALREIAEDAMRSSLAATSYGVAFPDFKRAIFPFFADEEFDRGPAS